MLFDKMTNITLTLAMSLNSAGQGQDPLEPAFESLLSIEDLKEVSVRELLRGLAAGDRGIVRGVDDSKDTPKPSRFKRVESVETKELYQARVPLERRDMQMILEDSWTGGIIILHGAFSWKEIDSSLYLAPVEQIKASIQAVEIHHHELKVELMTPQAISSRWSSVGPDVMQERLAQEAFADRLAEFWVLLNQKRAKKSSTLPTASSTLSLKKETAAAEIVIGTGLFGPSSFEIEEERIDHSNQADVSSTNKPLHWILSKTDNGIIGLLREPEEISSLPI